MRSALPRPFRCRSSPRAADLQSRRCHLPNNQIVNDHCRTECHRGHSLQHLLSRNQKRQNAAKRAAISLLIRTQPAASHESWSIHGEAAEYRARPAGRQLGAEILESIFRGPGLSVLHFYVFSDFPSSEVKYTVLEFRDKGAGSFSIEETALITSDCCISSFTATKRW